MVTLATWFTLARIALVPVFIVIMNAPFPNNEWIAAIVFCLAAVTDAFDGYIARKRNEVTKIGALLDPLADKLLVITALIFLIGEIPVWMAWVLIAREFVVVGLRLLVAPTQMIRSSFFGKLKTALEMVGIVAALLGLAFAWYVLLLAVIFSVWSGVEYIWRSRSSLKLL